MGCGVIVRRASRAVLATVLATSLVTLPVPVRAGTMTGGATEWTQITNMINLIQHTVSLVQSAISLQKQVEFWIQASKRADSPMDVLVMAQSLGAIVSRIQGLLFASGSIVERWKQTHPGRKAPEELGLQPKEAYHQIEKSTQSAVARSLEALDIQGNSADGWPKDRTIYANLQAKSQTVNGQLEAAMVGNELLLEVIRQLHLMRQIQISHAEMMGYHVSAESQRRQYDEEMLRRRVGYTGRYRGDEEGL